ncbi:MAG: helix-hairpin-helix domain-containing protein [Pirellulales bacterium]|nr:helix-hairpin-helix domain-containing protein [Pirellulales bacterium]
MPRLPFRLDPADWLRPRDQQSLAAAAACALLAMAGWWWARGGGRGELIDVDRAPPLVAKFQVDVNRANWPELIMLPGVGPILAEKLIADRLQNGPFNGLDDLRRVDGVGPRTLQRIRPYLLPLPNDREWAAGDNRGTINRSPRNSPAGEDRSGRGT